MEKDYTVYLHHILDAINTVEEYLRGVNEENFKATRLLQDGTIRQIEVIGEAIRHISKDTRKNTLKSLGRMSRECEINLFTITSALILKTFGILLSKTCLF
jgi:uncharacterized protein with HEPN domain